MHFSFSLHSKKKQQNHLIFHAHLKSIQKYIHNKSHFIAKTIREVSFDALHWLELAWALDAANSTLDFLLLNARLLFCAEKTDNKKMAKCAINFLYCSRHLFINGARPRIHFAAAAANGGEME